MFITPRAKGPGHTPGIRAKGCKQGQRSGQDQGQGQVKGQSQDQSNNVSKSVSPMFFLIFFSHTMWLTRRAWMLGHRKARWVITVLGNAMALTIQRKQRWLALHRKNIANCFGPLRETRSAFATLSANIVSRPDLNWMT